DKSFRNGVFVAAGDIDGDGTDEIIAGSGKDSLPKIKVFDGYGNLKSEFFAYAENFRGGVNVASGDIDGDGTDEIIAGAGNGGGPQVRIFDAKGVVKQQFFAYAENFRGGVNVASGDINQDGIDEIVTGAGQGGGPHVRVFDKDHILLKGFFAYDNSMSGGVNVAVINVKVK
ncbi:transporter, partial [Candidatus Falkowbacteria bacterium CG10_big_fil_rev_8_21_14_0_10_37_6]